MVKTREKTPIQIHKDCRRDVTLDEIHAVEGAEGPVEAAAILCSRGIRKACAVLDRMNPFGAAFVILILRTRMTDDPQATEIVKLAESLDLKATRCLVQARNDIYPRTGVRLP